MGDVLAELEEVLRSKPSKERITPKEEVVLQTCKARAIGDFTIGALASSTVVWFATRNLTHGHRFNASVGSAIITGMLGFNRSLNSCINEILELEGSRMQKELAQIILAKHHNSTSRMRLVKKHFYSEEVFSDSNPDKPYIRWRSRNFYIDDSERSKHFEDSNFHDKPDTHEKPDTMRTKQFARSPAAGDMIVDDPLDCILGRGEASKETSLSDNGASRRHLRAHKRANRHRRAQHAETKASGAISDD